MGVAPVMSDVLTLDILIEKGNEKLNRLSFQEPVIKIGRGSDNHLVIANDPKVSRNHAEIQQHGDEFFVLNTSQKNYILVNGTKTDREKLNPGDRIHIGDTVLKIQYTLKNKPVPSKSPEMLSVASVDAWAQKSESEKLPQIPGTPQHPPMNPSVNPTPAAMRPSGGVGNVNSMGIPQQQAPGVGMSGMGANPMMSRGMDDEKKKKIRFYLIVLALGGLIYWFFFTDSSAPKKDPNAVKDSTQILKELQQSQDSIGRLKEESEAKKSTAYLRAQENLVRALRDYNQGQYMRAQEGFQIVLNLDPGNEMARRYFNLSKTRMDQMVKEHMLQGARYREKGNWRLCADAFGKAMILLQGRRDDPNYKQAQKFHEECRLELEGRY